MTTAQLARAAGTDSTWLFNAERLLGRRFPRTVAGSRELALVRVIHSELGIDLATAAGMARARESRRRKGQVFGEPQGAVTLLIDPERFDSIWLLNLAAALDTGTRLRGRPLGPSIAPIERARRYGIDVELLRWQMSRTIADRLDSLDDGVLPRIVR